MRENMPLGGSVNHFEKTQNLSNLGKEEELFNTTIAESPMLQHVLRHLKIEEVEALVTDFQFETIDFQDVETEEQWDSLDEEMEALKNYFEKKEEIMMSPDADKIAKVADLKNEYRETIDSLKNKIARL